MGTESNAEARREVLAQIDEAMNEAETAKEYGERNCRIVIQAGKVVRLELTSTNVTKFH